MRKLNLSIVVGVIVAVLGAGMVVAYGQSVNKHATQGQDMVPVLVANNDLTAGSPATDLASQVHVAKVPAAYVVHDALSNTGALTSLPEGSVLTGTVPSGGQLSQHNFADTATAGHVSASPGNVAISVETDLSPGVARYLAVGSKVDVFATYDQVRDASGKLTNASSRTKLFASGVKVLAVSVAQEPSNSQNSTDAQMLSDKVVVLLDMTPTMAQKLVNATTLGEIYLADTTGSHDRTAKGSVPADVVAGSR